MGERCKICNQVFDERKEFNCHLRKHSITVASYYQKYYPRYDLHTNEIILFKNKEFYFTSDFNNKNSLRYWLNNQDKETQRDYCLKLLERRRDRKKIKYAPCQAELRTLMIPAVNYLDEVLGGYYQICEQMGLEAKYEARNEPIKEYELEEESVIFIDTREKKPLAFKNFKTEVKGLKYGDYALSSKKDTCSLHIERKSLSDFYATLSGGFERFKRELDRSVNDYANMVVVVESKIDKVASFKYTRSVFNKVKTSHDYIFRNMREIIQEYPNVQFLFVGGRKEAVRIIEKLFCCKCEYIKTDLQLEYDLKRL